MFKYMYKLTIYSLFNIPYKLDRKMYNLAGIILD